MKVIVNTSNILFNISRAAELSKLRVSLMFKDFYSFIYPHIRKNFKGRIFSKDIPGSICYSVSRADCMHGGAVVISLYDAMRCIRLGIRHIYIPVDANDNREGLCLSDAVSLADDIRSLPVGVRLSAMFTFGCVADNDYRFEDAWKELSVYFDELSIGGSRVLEWCGTDRMKEVSEIRIGEYMLFGTIPYCSDERLFGRNAIKVESKVLHCYKERNQILIDVGKSSVPDFKLCSDDFEVVCNSCEYTTLECRNKDIDIEDIAGIDLIPSYYSLITMKDCKYEFVERW